MSRVHLAVSALVALWFPLGWSMPVSAGDLPAGPGLTVRPETTDELLANPGMGWQTFHHPARQDRNLPAWIPSTVEYIRWGWRELEPRPGELDAGLIDRTLREAAASGQKLAFRVMCCSTTPNAPYHPAWLKEVGGRETTAEIDGRRFPVPDLDDPATLDRHLDFIKRLGARYDGHPDLDHVDLGSVGWWGEWHLSGGKNQMPSAENLRKVVDTYSAVFRKTPLLMLIGGGDALKHARDLGAGWRADCLGDLGGFSSNWCHMKKGYPGWFREAGLGDVWKTAPVAWETCWDLREWVRKGWPLRYIFNYALALHGSYLNNKSAPLPTGDDVRPEVERFLRRLGYRLVLEELACPSELAPGAPMELKMTWRNVGSAPCYRPYRLAYRFRDVQGRGPSVAGGLTVDHWLPGSIELFTESFLEAPGDLPPGDARRVSDRVTVPAGLAAGDYTLSIGVVDADPSRPVVRLGIKGRDADGWYPLGKVTVRP